MNTTSTLCTAIEKALHRKLKSPKDFDLLSQSIWDRLHEQVSSTTLKRIWGYLTDDIQPRESTLDILARFIGYQDWNSYQQQEAACLESQFVMSRHLNVDNTLNQGDRLRLTWQPARVCDVEYLGNQVFKVIASENTRLRAGDTFRCSLIVEGEPLYIDDLQQEGHPPVVYVCGKKSGVRFDYPLK
jgi:hypothetical protein